MTNSTDNTGIIEQLTRVETLLLSASLPTAHPEIQELKNQITSLENILVNQMPDRARHRHLLGRFEESLERAIRDKDVEETYRLTREVCNLEQQVAYDKARDYKKKESRKAVIKAAATAAAVILPLLPLALQKPKTRLQKIRAAVKALI